MASVDDDIALGRDVVRKAKLKPLRERLGLTRSAMAELLYTASATYETWELNPGTLLWPQTAVRIGRFYRTATETLRIWGGDTDDLVPLHVVSTQLAIPQETLMQWYRHGELETVDLGILGTWMTKAQYDWLRAERIRSRLELPG